MSKGERADLDATRAMLHQLVHMGQASERRGLAFESFSYIFSSARLQHLREQRERDKAEERAKLQHKRQLLRERQQQQQQQQQQLSPLLRQGPPDSPRAPFPPVGRGRSQSGAEPRAGAGHGHTVRQDSMNAAFFAAQAGSFFGRSSLSRSSSARGGSSQLNGDAEFASPLLGRAAGARPRRTLKWRVLIARKLRFVRTSRFDAVVYFIIVLNAVLLFDTMGTTTGHSITEDDERAQRVEEAFVVLYLLELLVKLLANGPRRFFRSKMNCFDALIIVATTLLEYGWATSSLSAESDGQRRTTLRLALVLRLLRLLRVLVALKRFNRIFATFVSLLPAFGTMFGMLWAIFNFFAEVGIGYFGGEVCAQALNGTGCAQSLNGTNATAGGRAFAAAHYEVRWADSCC